MDLTFGWRTAVLAVAASVVLPLAWTLWRSVRNRVAARTLAMGLLAMVGVFTPWMIGFAGFYDRWRWLTFAPFANGLLVPAMLYLHCRALTEGRWPSCGWRHLLPGAAQFTYQSACFLLPMPLKERWADSAFDRGDVVFAVLQAISFLIYGSMILSLMRKYRVALREHRSDDALFAGGWIIGATASFTMLAVVWAGYSLWNAVSPLGYVGLMPLYAAIAGIALYLGIAGWHYLAVSFPKFADLATPVPTGAQRDWRVLGDAWSARTREAGWHRDDALTLKRLAGLLGTNTTYLSRALNEGLGVTFSEFVNGLRCEEVAAALRAGDERPILDLAFDAGFASKASFNRSFLDTQGMTPSAMRANGRLNRHK